MADSHIHINESSKVTCQRFLNHVFAEYKQPTAPAFPPGSASNPVLILDDDQPGSALNPLVIPDNEPLNPRLGPQPSRSISSENLAVSLQDQHSVSELEGSPSPAPESGSASSRPSSNSGSSVTSGLLSILSSNSILDQTSTAETASAPDQSSTGESTTTADPSARSHAFPISDASPSNSTLSNVSLPLHSAFRWASRQEPASPPRRDDSCQPAAADLWNDTICSKCEQRGHVASAHCSTCGLPGHSASDHCRMCQQVGHSDRDHCILCSQFGHCVVGYCARARCKQCGLTGHDDSHHCTRCSVLGHRHYHHCDVCDTFKCKTEDHCYVCAELGHTSKDHCEVCEELGHAGNDHCWGCKQLGHCWNECQELYRGIFCRICRSLGHGSNTCLSRKQNELREKWAFKRLQRSRSDQLYCQCCLEIREPGYSFHQEHKLKDCPKLTHKIACLKRDHDNDECLKWIQRSYRSTATQVNLAEYSTNVDVRRYNKGKERDIVPPPIFVAPNVFTTTSSSTQTAFPEVYVGRGSDHNEEFDCIIHTERPSVGNKAKTLEDLEVDTQDCDTERGHGSDPSTCIEASDLAFLRSLPEKFEEDQREGSEEFELPRLEREAQCRSDMQKIIEEIMLEEDETPDAETTSFDAQDQSEVHLSTSSIELDDVQIVFESLLESLSILEKNLEEGLSEEANMPAVQVSSSGPQTFASIGLEQVDFQHTNESSAWQEIEEENLSSEKEIVAVRASSPVSLDREHNQSAEKSTIIVASTLVSSQDVLTTCAPSRAAKCSTVGCLSPPSSNNAKCNSCCDARSSGKHKQQSWLIGNTSVRKRKSKPRKALANKKRKPDANLESPCPASDGGTVAAQAGIKRNQGVSLPGGLHISWKEIVYLVMLEAPNHSSNFQQLYNLVRNWLHNTFPSLDFDIDNQDMLQILHIVVKSSDNFESHKSDQKKKSINPLEFRIREDAVKRVEIVVSCFRTKFVRPEYHERMITDRLPQSGTRPEISFENLIGMALHAADRKYSKEIQIVLWITKSIPGYKGEGSWIPRLREELHASSFFAKRVSDAGDEEWKFRKGCSRYFGKWDGGCPQA